MDVLILAAKTPDALPFLQILGALFTIGLLLLLIRIFKVIAVVTRFVATLPSILATIGVIGTFFGIWLGLQDFDVSNIEQSVPLLLTGLKTAFLTSLVGMGLSVVFRLLAALVPAKTGTSSSSQDLLQQLLKELQLSRSEQSEHLKNLYSAIAADGGSTLTVQLSQLRNETRDGLSAIQTSNIDNFKSDQELQLQQHTAQMESFDAFAKHMVANTHKALVEALESVIQDFNQNLSEQFGENFKQLNIAVHSLVDWQENYRDHIDRVETLITNLLDSTGKAEQSMQAIAQSAESIPEAIEPLAETLIAIEHAMFRLNEDLESFADLGSQARVAFPEVQKSLDLMTQGIRQSVDTMLQSNTIALTDQRAANDSLREGHETVLRMAHLSQSTFDTAVQKTMERVHHELETAAKNLTSQMNATLGDTDKQMKEQLVKLDRQLGQELESALEALSNNLVSLSRQFVDDYGPLTKQLQAVVRIAEGMGGSDGSQLTSVR